jgi:Na+/proline symporter
VPEKAVDAYAVAENEALDQLSAVMVALLSVVVFFLQDCIPRVATPAMTRKRIDNLRFMMIVLAFNSYIFYFIKPSLKLDEVKL